MDVQEDKLKKGAWIGEEDEKLIATVSALGERRWDALAKASGLRRSGKSCRLRWMNYLRPNLKHARMNAEEEILIFQLHTQWGNKWAKIAQKLPGRTDNDIKNYWRSQLRKKTQEALPQDHCSDETPINDSNKDKNRNAGMSYPNSSIDVCMSVNCDNAGISSSNYDTPTSPYQERLTDWTHSDAEKSFESLLWDGSYSIWNASY